MHCAGQVQGQLEGQGNGLADVLWPGAGASESLAPRRRQGWGEVLWDLSFLPGR